MNLYCFLDQVIGNSTTDVQAVARTLLAIWTQSFVLSDQPPVRTAGR
jgi:hypothetical protein